MDGGWQGSVRSSEGETGLSWGGHSPPSLFLQLPSNQTLRFRGNKAAAWEAAYEGLQEPLADAQELLVPQSVLGEEDEDSKPLKELPLCLKEKQQLRALQEQAVQRMSGWQLWHLEKRRTVRRLRSQANGAISHAEIWRSTLRHIEGHFGTGIQSYFNFLRFLVLMNFVASLLVLGFVVVPTALLEALELNKTSQQNNSVANASCLHYNPIPQGLVSYFSFIMDLLSGKGFTEFTYLFYGYYQNSAIDFVGFSYNIPLAYLLTALFYLAFCLVWIVRRSVYCLKRSLVNEDASLGSYTNKVFAGWDFGLIQPRAMQLRQKSIRYELRMDLEEERVRKQQADMTTAQSVSLYLLRFLLNVLVLALLGGSFFCIFLATDYSQKLMRKTDSPIHDQFFLELLVNYLPSIVITAANLLIPTIFEFIVQLEKYPLSFQIKITLFRSVFLRLASLVVLLISLWDQITCNGHPEDSRCQNCGYNNQQHPVRLLIRLFGVSTMMLIAKVTITKQWQPITWTSEDLTNWLSAGEMSSWAHPHWLPLSQRLFVGPAGGRNYIH